MSEGFVMAVANTPEARQAVARLVLRREAEAQAERFAVFGIALNDAVRNIAAACGPLRAGIDQAVASWNEAYAAGVLEREARERVARQR